ncbi:MAG: hypothetical protein Kow0037_11240 [Calditrichia bacterium]
MVAPEQMRFLHSQTQSLEKPFYIEKWVTRKDGGVLLNGNPANGYSYLYFYSYALPQDTLIQFSWDSQGYVTDLAPHGIQFQNTVYLRLSYKDADLSNINEDNLRIWYYNEHYQMWELIGGYVNKTDKYVIAPIQHFSRYAIGDMP